MAVSMFVEYIIPKPTTDNSTSANIAASIAMPRSVFLTVGAVCDHATREFLCSFIARVSLLATSLETYRRLRTVVQADRRHESGDRLLACFRIDGGGPQCHHGLYGVHAGSHCAAIRRNVQRQA